MNLKEVLPMAREPEVIECTEEELAVAWIVYQELNREDEEY